jgi:hypothetical protein
MSIATTRPALILSILLISGCTMNAVAPDKVTLMTARTGQTVKLTLSNESGGPIGYNLCTSALQRHTAGKWAAVETGDICTMEIRTLQNGSTATFDKTLPDDTVSGEYRYAANVDSNGTPIAVASDPFQVP